MSDPDSLETCFEGTIEQGYQSKLLQRNCGFTKAVSWIEPLNRTAHTLLVGKLPMLIEGGRGSNTHQLLARNLR